MKLIYSLILAIVLTLPVSALAAETSGSASADILSNYVWRGLKLSDDQGVIQPSVGITSGAFGANLWANYDMDTNEHNETDLTLSYSRSMDKLSYEAGFIYYALDGLEDTQELYLSLSYDAPLSPSATLYYDYDEGDGAFLVLSVGHSVPVGDYELSLGASASVNFDNDLMMNDTDGDGNLDDVALYNGEVTASIAIPVFENVTIEPKAAYTFPLSSDAKDTFEGTTANGNSGLSIDNDSSIFYGGVGISISF